MNENVLARGIQSQLLASLHALQDCIARCPENEWHGKHQDYPFSQIAFHTLFDCDLNLSADEADLKGQVFHVANLPEFGDYEELRDTIKDRRYDKKFIIAYHLHCLGKVGVIMDSITMDELLRPNADFYRSMTKAERYINCIRHTQHHAAQLGFRLQIITGKEMEWIGRADG